MFIYFERDRDSVTEGGAERMEERIPSRLRAVSPEPDARHKLTNHEIMT